MFIHNTGSTDRSTDQGILAIESELSNTLNFNHIINIFANQKAGKAHLP